MGVLPTSLAEKGAETVAEMDYISRVEAGEVIFISRLELGRFLRYEVVEAAETVVANKVREGRFKAMPGKKRNP